MIFKYLKVLMLVVLVVAGASAQQDNLYTQFMYNKLGINPAYAGNDDALCITGIIRDQWTGFDGSPKAQSLSVNFPSFGKVGLGINISRHTIGVNEKMTIEGIYAYRFKIKGGNLSMGMSFSGRSYKKDFADPRLNIIRPFGEDEAIDHGIYKTSVFNLGFGAYYSNNRFYIGAAVPRLMRADIDVKVGERKSFEVRHVYLMSGGAMDIRKNLVLMPQILFRWAENSPYNLDLNLGFLFYDKFYAATTLRTGGISDNWFESVDFLLGFHISNKLFLATAYDVTLSPLRKYENGSIELLLQYCFGKDDKSIRVINPRFF